MRAVLILLAPISVLAQTPRTLPLPGDEVRVWTANPARDAARGTVKRVATDTVVFSIRSKAARMWLDTPVETRNITRLEVLAGRQPSRRRTVIGYATGAVLGFAAGGYVGYRLSPLYCDPSAPCPPGESADAIQGVLSIAIGAVAGSGVGGGIGWAIGRRPVATWRQVWP